MKGADLLEVEFLLLFGGFLRFLLGGFPIEYVGGSSKKLFLSLGNLPRVHLVYLCELVYGFFPPHRFNGYFSLEFGR